MLKALFLCGSVTIGSGAAAATLEGVVRDTSGAPVRGAFVSIWEAGPLSGIGQYCPSCYPDCAKRTRTDGRGRFRIGALDDSLGFRVLVVARGYSPDFIERVVPSRGPVEKRLRGRDVRGAPDSIVLRGILLDPLGRPVVGALVRPIGYRRGRLRSFGAQSGDPMAVTDEAGRFQLVTAIPPRFVPPSNWPQVADSALVWLLRVEARGLAQEILQDVPTGPQENRLRMRFGSSLSGRIARDSTPVPGVVMAACQVNRMAQTFAGIQKVSTDAAGRFFIPNLLPDTRYVVFGTMESFARHGAAPLLEFTTAPEDSTIDLGVLEPGPRRRLRGLMTWDGGVPPIGTPVSLGRPQAFDDLRLRTDERGRFEFDALPAESLEVTPMVLDHHIDPATPGMDPVYHGSVHLADRGDVDLELPMVAGPREPSVYDRPPATRDRQGPPRGRRP